MKSTGLRSGRSEMKIIDKKIQLMPHESRIGYVVCKKCAGVGWLMTDDEKYIEQCRECNGTGLNRICAHCGNIYTIACYCDGAITSRRKTAEEQEQKRYEKARKISLYDAKQYEMFYSDKYRGNEGYFNAEDIYDIMDYCDLGSYVWGTTYSPLKIYASDIVSNATEDSWEGAYDAINPYDIAKLQEQLDDFCNKANKSGAGTYDVDYTTAILL